MKAQGVAAAGSRPEFRWLSKGDVTFAMASHQNSFGDPVVALAPRFFLAPRSEKLRLQNRNAIFSLRMTYGGFVCCLCIRKVQAPHNNKKPFTTQTAPSAVDGAVCVYRFEFFKKYSQISAVRHSCGRCQAPLAYPQSKQIWARHRILW